MSRQEKEARRKKKEEKRAQAEAKAREEAAEKEKAEVATMDSIDTYMEMLYEEDAKAKINATALILQLARNVANLEVLIQNESLLASLSRTLKEEYKKNMDLTINIMHIFFSFSTFSQMHPVLVNYRIGDVCMRVMDLEKKRYAMRIAVRDACLAAAALRRERRCVALADVAFPRCCRSSPLRSWRY